MERLKNYLDVILDSIRNGFAVYGLAKMLFSLNVFVVEFNFVECLMFALFIKLMIKQC